jgi:hypothetical protein
MALFTALLAGIFSLSGAYVIAKIQARHATTAKALEYRAQAYSGFLQKLDWERSPLVSRLLNIGSLADRVATDGEIQALEDRIADLLKQLDPQEAYWQLSSDFNLLRLHGDIITDKFCSDILALLSFRHHEVNWAQYSKQTQDYYRKWRKNQNERIAYGWEEKVDKEERFMVVMVSRLFNELIDHLRSGLRS